MAVRLVLALLAPMLATGAALAAPIWGSAALFGGDVRTVEIDPRDPDYLLAGTASGQIFASQDGGDTWKSAGPLLPFPGWDVQALLFDPNQTQRVWAALKSPWEERGLVALSDDRGRTWQKRSHGLPGRQVYSLAAVPGSPGVVFAGTRVGVFGTNDHGRSWRSLTADHRDIKKVTSLLVEPRGSGELPAIFAGTWRRAYRSDDGGQTWRRLDEGMALDSEVFTIQWVPGRSGELWASTCGWVYHGKNRGDSWVRFQKGLDNRRTPAFEVLPSGRLLAGTTGGVFLSDDDGRSWRQAGPLPLIVSALTHHPARPDRVFAAIEGGAVWRSLDGGATFSPSSTGLNGMRIAGLAKQELGTGASRRYEIVAAVRNAASFSGIYRSADGGRSFRRGSGELPGVLGLAALDGELYASTERGLFHHDGEAWKLVGALGSARVDALLHDGDSLWVSVAGRRYRLAAGSREFMRQSENWPMKERWSSLPRRLPTGDEVWPLLEVGAEGRSFLVGSSGARLDLGLEVPAADYSAAVVHDGRLLVGTAGYGVLAAEVSDLVRASPARTIITTAR